MKPPHRLTAAIRALAATAAAPPRNARLQWAAFWSVLLLALVTSVWLSTRLRETMDARRRTNIELSALQSKIDTARGLDATSTASAPAADFTRALADFVDPQPVLESVRRICAQNSVSITAFNIQPRPAQRGQLQRTDLTFSLRGSYGNLKQVVADSVGTSRGATVAHLSMRRVPQQADAEATVLLALWAKPAVALEPASSRVAQTGPN